ncbi:unnamed protein product [Caenorhabditis nigoni]
MEEGYAQFDGHPDPGHPDPGHPDPGHPDPGHPDPDHPNPGHADSARPDPGHPNPGHPNPGHPDPGHPGSRSPESRSPGSRSPGSRSPGSRSPGQGNPNPGHQDPGHPDPDHPNPGHPDLGHPDPGHPDPGHPVPGHPDPVHQDPVPGPGTQDPWVTFSGAHLWTQRRMCSPACIRVTIRILKILGYILFGILAITSALCFLCVSYVTLLIMLPPLERVHIHYMTKLTRYLGYDNYERWDPNAKLSAWGTPYDAACGEIRMVLLKLDCMEPANTCMEKIEMFERDEWIRMDRRVQEKIFHNVSKECFQAMTCMTDLACREATYQFNIFHKIPHNFFLNHSSFSNCMARFMKVVRDEGSNHNCTRDFQFLSNDPIIKNESFYHGRDCFMNVTQEFCAPDVLYYLDSYYEFFLKFAMTPTENGCGIYEKLLSLDCQDSMEDFRESVNFAIICR